MIYFILGSYDVNESVIYLEVPEALTKETREYIEAHTRYEIAAVVSEFVEKPDVTPIRRFLEHDLNETLRGFFHCLWIGGDILGPDELIKLAKRGDWGKLTSLLWEPQRRKIEAEAPHKVYQIRVDDPSLSERAKIEETDEVIPLEDVLAQAYAKLEEAIADVTQAYTAGRKILDRLPMRQEER